MLREWVLVGLCAAGCAKHKVMFELEGGPYVYREVSGGLGARTPCDLAVSITAGTPRDVPLVEASNGDWKSPEYGVSSGELKLEVHDFSMCQGPITCVIWVDGVARVTEIGKDPKSAKVTCSMSLP